MQVFDELIGFFRLTLNFEGQHGTRPAREVFLGQCVVRAAFQSRIVHPFDLRMPLEPFGEGLGIGNVAFHS